MALISFSDWRRLRSAGHQFPAYCRHLAIFLGAINSRLGQPAANSLFAGQVSAEEKNKLIVILYTFCFPFEFEKSIKITTGMNPEASCGVHTLRCAGLFNLPIPQCCAHGIGVSQQIIGKSPLGILIIGHIIYF